MSAFEINEISAESREKIGSLASNKLRRDGKVPAVLYGHGLEAKHIAVGAREIQLALDHGARIVTLKTPGGAESALFKDVQYDVYGKDVVHIDFFRVSMDEAITLEVAIELHGEIVDEGVVDHELHNLEVECRADAIPENFRVEIGGMQVGDVIRVEDMELPDGVKAITDPETVVVAIHPPTEEEEPVEEGEELAEPELIGEAEEESEEEGAEEEQEEES